MKKKQKNTKIQSVFLAAIEKYQKNTKVPGVFVCIYCVFFVFFCFFKKKYEKKTKKYKKKYESKISKIQNTKKKIQTQNLENTKYKKKYKPKNSKIQNSEKYKFNVRKKRQNPCSLSEETPELQKKNAKPTCCIFLHPAVLILHFQVVFFVFFVFLCILNYLRNRLLYPARTTQH